MTFLPTPGRRQRGLTLIELMISVAIGLVVLGALLVVYLGSRSAYRSSDNLARVQEAGRFAIEFIAQDARMAGFMGCRSRNVGPGVDDPAAPKPPEGWNFTSHVDPTVLRDYGGALDAVVGFKDLEGWKAAWGEGTNGVPKDFNYWRGHVITIRRADDRQAVRISAFSRPDPVSGTPGSVTLEDPLDMDPPRQSLALLADCAHAFVFQWGTFDAATSKLTYAGDPPTKGTSGKAYDFTPDWLAEVRRFDEVAYYVGFPPEAAAKSDEEKSRQLGLYRFVRGSAKPELLVDYVEDLEVVYGMNTSGDEVVDTHRRTDDITSRDDWQQVVSARVSLLVAGPEEKITTGSGPQRYALRDTSAPPDGLPDLQDPTDRDGKAINDGRLRHVYTTTISLRNRVW